MGTIELMGRGREASERRRDRMGWGGWGAQGMCTGECAERGGVLAGS